MTKHLPDLAETDARSAKTDMEAGDEAVAEADSKAGEKV